MYLILKEAIILKKYITSKHLDQLKSNQKIDFNIINNQNIYCPSSKKDYYEMTKGTQKQILSKPKRNAERQIQMLFSQHLAHVLSS